MGASLMIIERDAISVRQDRPCVFTDPRGGDGVDLVAAFVIEQGMLE